MNAVIRGIRFEAVPCGLSESFVFRDCYHRRINVNWHHHPELELVLVTGGSGIRFIGDSIGVYGPGDLLFLGSNTPHAWQSDPHKYAPNKSLLIQFSPTFLGEPFMKKPELRRVEKFFEFARCGLKIEGKTRKRVVDVLAQMRRERPGSLQRLCWLLTVLAMLAECRDCRPLSTAPIEPVLNQKAHQRINSVIKFIGENLTELPPQTTVARVAHMSPVTFSRFFKRCVGKSYMEYVTALRIGLACRELVETDKSITEVALCAGFNTLSNFNRLFRKLKRFSPRAFRKAMVVREAPAIAIVS